VPERIIGEFLSIIGAALLLYYTASYVIYTEIGIVHAQVQLNFWVCVGLAMHATLCQYIKCQNLVCPYT